MGLSIVLVLWSALACAAADSHTVSVTVSSKESSYVHTIQLQGAQTNFVGAVPDAWGGATRQLIINMTISPAQAGPGAFQIQYAIELQGPMKGAESPIQAQSTLVIRPNIPVRAVSCDDWSIDLRLDPSGEQTAASSPIEPNFRVGARLEQGRRHTQCEVLVPNGSQAHVGRRLGRSGNRATGLMIDFIPVESAGSISMQYRLASNPKAGGPVDRQETANLVPGQNASVSGPGYRLILMADHSPIHSNGGGPNASGRTSLKDSDLQRDGRPKLLPLPK